MPVPTAPDTSSSVQCSWIPLGAGARVVRFSGRAFEAICARLEGRPPCDLYHAALQIRTAEGTYVLEMTPVPDDDGAHRGVVAGGAVGSRWLGRVRVFRYEVRCWRDGVIPDLDAAVGGAQLLSDDPAVARRVLAAVRDVPAPVWGRDDLGAGEMWNSNSVTAWTLARAGLDLRAVHPPVGGRAPGWDAGLVVAARAPSEQTKPPGHLPAAAQRRWIEMSRPADEVGGSFDPACAEDLPTPIERWLRHAIQPGTPLRRRVHVTMHGEIKIGRWRPFTARQLIAPDGYLWAADAGRFPMRVQGFDRYSEGTGQMSWRLLGVVPVVTARGADIDRSAAGRLASELLGLTPAGALAPGVVWHPIDDRQAIATVTIDGLDHHVTVSVGDDGAVQTISLPRWADADGGGFRLHTFGVICDGERTFGGYRLPHRIRAGWWLGTPEWAEGEFFRATIDDARFS